MKVQESSISGAVLDALSWEVLCSQPSRGVRLAVV